MNSGIQDTADALWRAIVYASVCQLHLRGNVLLSEPLSPGHVKERPSGHWGTVPGTAWVLAHVALAATGSRGKKLIPLLGAGHAGVVQLSVNWLNGRLARVRPQFSPDVRGLTALAASFPDVDRLGSEVCPGLYAGDFLGGRLGGCLPFAQGGGMGALDRIMVPVIGDGECETPVTAAAWLAHTMLDDVRVLPVVQVNGFRMGAASLLGALKDQELLQWAAGLGWGAVAVTVAEGSRAEHAVFHDALRKAISDVDHGRPTMVFLRCVKGWGCPESVNGQAILGTPRVHKTPLRTAGTDPAQRDLLRKWLASYRPADLFDQEGRPRHALARALTRARWDQLPATAALTLPRSGSAPVTSFAEAVTQAVRSWAGSGNFRVFSPDELASNRLATLAGQPFATEVLAEEVLLEWLAGWTASGRRGMLISYEAFASLLVPGLVSHLKQRRLATSPALPSLNVLLTSYGWHNTYTHGDPTAATALLGVGDPAVRVLTPADPVRLAATLEECLASAGRVNVIIAGKHNTASFPAATLDDEMRCGLAVWPQLSDPGDPDLTIVTAGDLPAQAVAACSPELRSRLRCKIRVVNIADLTVLGPAATWPRGLTDADLDWYLGTDAAVLFVTLGHPAAVWGLLQGRLRRPAEVIGWREPPAPMPQSALAQNAGLDADGITAAANRLLSINGAHK
jgi:xylulose-5-phosphate/fructose-6-phosphate phosphoketolase